MQAQMLRLLALIGVQRVNLHWICTLGVNFMNQNMNQFKLCSLHILKLALELHI